jgi:hypothetical protein
MRCDAWADELLWNIPARAALARSLVRPRMRVRLLEKYERMARLYKWIRSTAHGREISMSRPIIVHSIYTPL